jgi:hypothetical protein
MSYALASNLITGACLYIVDLYEEKAIYIVNVLFWVKIITLGIFFYFINNHKKDVFYYYKNLGLTKKQLWIPTLTFDLMVFIILIVLTIQIK